MKKRIVYALVFTTIFALLLVVIVRFDDKIPVAGTRESFAGRQVSGTNDFPDLDVTKWGEEVELEEAGRRQKIRIRLADSYLSNGKPKIRVGEVGEETGTASVFYPNGVHQVINRFPWEGRFGPADWYSKLVEAENKEIRENQGLPGHGDPGTQRVETMIAGNPGYFLEQGYNEEDGKRSPRPAWVTWYQIEDKREYNLSADNMPVGKLLAMAESIARDENKEVIPSAVRPFIIAIRAIRAEYRLPSEAAVVAQIQANESNKEKLVANRSIIMKMANLEDVSIVTDIQRPPKAASVVVEGCRLFLLLDKALNIPEEKTRVLRELDKVNTYLTESESALKGEAPGRTPETQLLLERLQNWRDYLEQKARSFD